MTQIITVTGLYGDKNYALQARPVFGDGTKGSWGPSFAIVRRDISTPVTANPITPTTNGVRFSWVPSALSVEHGEQWLVKKFDIQKAQFTDGQFDSSGIDVYRGVGQNYVDVDLNQESYICLGVVKVDRYGNRSPTTSVSLSDQLFDAPTAVVNSTTTVKNISDGFSVQFQKVSSTPPLDIRNGYHVVKLKYGLPFTSYKILNKQKSGNTCTLILETDPEVAVGTGIQISTGDTAIDTFATVLTSVLSGTNTITYTHPTSSTVTSQASTGYVIPTSSGPSSEGSEESRISINSAIDSTIKLDLRPEIPREKVYVAIGTEDIYQNRVSWTISDATGNPLRYGVNYIAQGFTPSITTSPNLIEQADSSWKYGYIGLKTAHAAGGTSGDRNLIATTTAPNVIVSTPSNNIKIGIKSGTTTAADYADAPANNQVRYYPSIQTELTTAPTTIDSSLLAKPMIDDGSVIGGTPTVPFKSILEDWTLKYPQNSGKAMVWVESSDRDSLDNNTVLPSTLDGTGTVNGRFTAVISQWSVAQRAKLSLYAVTGSWSPTSADAIYDPHFNPLSAVSGGVSNSKTYENSYKVSEKAASTSSRTIYFEKYSEATPIPIGSLINVSIGDTRFDGIRVVTGSSNDGATKRAVSFDEVATATVARTSANGTVSVINSERFIPSSATKASGTVTVTLPTTAAPAVDSYIFVGGINPIDSYSMLNTKVTALLSANRLTYTQSLVNSAATTSLTNPSLLSVESAPQEPTHNLIKSWSINNTGEDDFTTIRTLDWSWVIPQNVNAQTVRFVWVLEFDETDFGTFGISQEYTLLLDSIEAWPGSADESDDNTWTDDQEFKARVEFKDSVLMQSTLDVEGDLTVDPGDIYYQGARILPPGETFFYSLDHPRLGGSTFGATGVHAVVNSIVASDPVIVSSEYVKYTVDWSGQFISSVTNRQWLFTLWRFVYSGTDFTSGGEWIQVKTVQGTCSNVDTGNELTIGASISHSDVVLDTEMNKPTFMVTGIRSGTTGGSLTTLHVDTDSKTLYPRNRMTAEVSAYDKTSLPTISLPTEIKPWTAGVAFANDTTLLDPEVDANWSQTYNTRTPGKIIKEIKFTGGGWKCYRGDGDDLTSNSLLQGYWNNDGNHKSVWFMQPGMSASTSGSFTNARVIAARLEIVGRDFNSSGIIVIGTHEDQTGPDVQYALVVGKNANRIREPMGRNDEVSEIDLGTGIGSELWNGALNGVASSSATIANHKDSYGIILGPAPEQWDKFKGSFKPTGMAIYLTIEYG